MSESDFFMSINFRKIDHATIKYKCGCYKEVNPNDEKDPRQRWIIRTDYCKTHSTMNPP